MSDAVAIAIATGMPLTMSARKPPSSAMSALERLGALEHAVAELPVPPGDLQRAQEHEREAEQHAGEDDADRQVDHRHLLAADALQEEPREPYRIAEEEAAHDVDRGRYDAPHCLRHQAVEVIDLNVIVLAHRHRGADEHHRDEEVA